MRRKVEHHLGVIRTTAIGGVVFLLPLVIVGVLLAQAGRIVVGAVVATQKLLADAPAWGLPGWLSELLSEAWFEALLFAAAAALLALICFVCGVVAKRSLGRWFSQRAERYLMMLFPRYVVFKEQLAGNLGGEAAGGSLRPAAIRFGETTQLGLEVERAGNDGGDVVVYLPNAPDPWTGRVLVVPASDVRPIDTDVGEFLAVFEKLGRGAGEHAEAARSDERSG
ncbi:MAG: hypothetical protein AAF805_14990 [Planctomycetota bacterium]